MQIFIPDAPGLTLLNKTDPRIIGTQRKEFFSLLMLVMTQNCRFFFLNALRSILFLKYFVFTCSAIFVAKEYLVPRANFLFSNKLSKVMHLRVKIVALISLGLVYRKNRPPVFDLGKLFIS